MISLVSLFDPLDPSPDQARSSLRRELLKPEYNDQNLVQRLLDRLQRLLGSAIDTASAASPVQTLISMLVLICLVAGLVWLLSRARVSARHSAVADGAVLTAEQISATQLRARAEAAFADGRHADALVDGFRALALRQMERGRIEDAPGATAHEVALALEATYPVQRERVGLSAGRFDSVLYGDRPATAGQARDVLVLDDELQEVR